MMDEFFYCDSCGNTCAGLAFFKNVSGARKFIRQFDSGEEIVLQLAVKGGLVVRRFNSSNGFLSFAT